MLVTSRSLPTIPSGADAATEVMDQLFCVLFTCAAALVLDPAALEALAAGRKQQMADDVKMRMANIAERRRERGMTREARKAVQKTNRAKRRVQAPFPL